MNSTPPFIAQERPDACAIACLRMVLAHQGREISEAELVQATDLLGSAAVDSDQPVLHRNVSIDFPEPPASDGDLGRVDQFRIVQELGRGATGIVYKAYDEKLGRDVAIKVMNPEPQAIESTRARFERAARFEREARALAGLTHNHIVAIYQVGATPNFPPYLVMEYIEGETLAQPRWPHRHLQPRRCALRTADRRTTIRR